MRILMRKHLPLLLGVAAAAWIIGGTIWYKNHFCSTPIAPISQGALTAKVMNPRDGAIYTPICFQSGNSNPIFHNESLLALKQTATFLNDNSDKSLVIKGLYDTKETSETPSVNLGLARAEAVKTALTYLGVSTTIETTTEQRANLIANRQNGQPLCEAVEFALIDNPNARFEALNLYFKKDRYAFKENAELERYFTDLHQFLQKHPSAKLVIAAHRSDTEGGKMSKNRLAYAATFLKKHAFNIQQFTFEDHKSTNPLVTAEVAHMKNQRIEFRVNL